MDSQVLTVGDFYILVGLLISILSIIIGFMRTGNKTAKEKGVQEEKNRNMRKDIDGTGQKLNKHIEDDKEKMNIINEIRREVSAMGENIKTLLLDRRDK